MGNRTSYNVPQECDKYKNANCSVCFEDLDLDNVPINICGLVQCGHLFHFNCLKDLLSYRKRCPKCNCRTSKYDNVVIIEKPISSMLKWKTTKEKRAILKTFSDVLPKITI